MTTNSPRSRIGVDVGTDLGLVAAVEWASANDVHHLDVCLDDTELDPAAYSADEVAAVRTTCADHDVDLGLHTNSATNVAETAPHVGDAVDEYLRAYVDVADAVGASRVIVHGGYHFTDDVEERVAAAKARLRRASEYAADRTPTLLLENHNVEPDASEMHYLPVELDRVVEFLDDLSSDGVRWTFNAPHARQFPEGIDGYLDAVGVDLVDQVRLNDNVEHVEEHLYPGEGTLDFRALFRRLEESGYDGHYMLRFGTLDEMLAGREYLVDRYEAATA
jgi:sugar phosphate isomerase/epimerase